MHQERHRPRHEALRLCAYPKPAKTAETRPRLDCAQKACKPMLFRSQMLWLKILLAIAGGRLILLNSDVRRLQNVAPAMTTKARARSRWIFLWCSIRWFRLRLAIEGARISLLRHDIGVIRASIIRSQAARFINSFKLKTRP